MSNDRPVLPDPMSTDDPPLSPTHEPPGDVDEATVEAVGKLSEAYEYLIRARGHLYSFHQLMGRVDKLIDESAHLLRDAGHDPEASMLAEEIVGRNVLDGRWTFQIVEEFDFMYWEPVTEAERTVREALLGGRRHVFESALKDERITPGQPGHERRPPTTHDPRIETE